MNTKGTPSSVDEDPPAPALIAEETTTTAHATHIPADDGGSEAKTSRGPKNAIIPLEVLKIMATYKVRVSSQTSNTGKKTEEDKKAVAHMNVISKCELVVVPDPGSLPVGWVFSFFYDKEKEECFFNESHSLDFVKEMLERGHGLIHYTLKRNNCFFIASQVWNDFLAQQFEAFGSKDAERFAKHIITFVWTTKPQVKAGLRKNAHDKAVASALATPQHSTALPPVLTSPVAGRSTGVQLLQQPTEAQTSTNAQPLQQPTRPPPTMAGQHLTTEALLLPPSGVDGTIPVDPQALLKQLHGLGRQWVELHTRGGARGDAFGETQGNVMEKLLRDKSVAISDPKEVQQAWEIIYRLLLGLQSYAASGEEHTETLQQGQHYPPASAADFFSLFVQGLSQRANGLDEVEQGLSRRANMLDELQEHLENTSQQLDDLKEQLVADMEDFVVAKLMQDDEIEEEKAKLAELKQNVKKQKVKASELSIRRESLKAEVKSMQADMQALQEKQTDLSSMVELVSVSHLAMIVGGMLPLLQEEEKAAMLRTVVEWARAETYVALSHNVNPRIGKC